MSYYAGGVSPSFASQQLPGGGSYQQQPYSPTPQPAYQQGYPRAYSPQPGMAPAPPTGAAAQPQIQAGAVTYTTSTGPDGHVIYHCFKYVPDIVPSYVSLTYETELYLPGMRIYTSVRVHISYLAQLSNTERRGQRDPMDSCRSYQCPSNRCSACRSCEAHRSVSAISGD